VNGSQCFGIMSGTIHHCHSITSHKQRSLIHKHSNKEKKKISSSIREFNPNHSAKSRNLNFRWTIPVGELGVTTHLCG
jgi:hypothetical protein